MWRMTTELLTLEEELHELQPRLLRIHPTSSVQVVRESSVRMQPTVIFLSVPRRPRLTL
jgi:hypothetical protein